MGTVSIINPRKEVFVFTLYHNVYCANGGTCNCEKQNVLRPLDGGLRYTDIINPVGVYLEGETTQKFDSAVLQIQQVASAIETGRLKKVEVVETVPVAEVASTAVAKTKLPKKEA